MPWTPNLNSRGYTKFPDFSELVRNTVIKIAQISRYVRKKCHDSLKTQIIVNGHFNNFCWQGTWGHRRVWYNYLLKALTFIYFYSVLRQEKRKSDLYSTDTEELDLKVEQGKNCLLIKSNFLRTPLRSQPCSAL